MLKKQLNNEEGNNLSEPDPELGQRSPREDAQKKEENKRTDAEPPPITKIRTTGLQKKSEPKTSLQWNTVGRKKIIEHSEEVLKNPWIGIPKEEHAQRHYCHNTIQLTSDCLIKNHSKKGHTSHNRPESCSSLKWSKESILHITYTVQKS